MAAWPLVPMRQKIHAECAADRARLGLRKFFGQLHDAGPLSVRLWPLLTTMLLMALFGRVGFQYQGQRSEAPPAQEATLTAALSGLQFLLSAFSQSPLPALF
jgi:hypothetical protein